MLTGGLFGRPVSHSDIGGYTNVFHPSNTSLVYSRSKVIFSISMLLLMCSNQCHMPGLNHCCTFCHLMPSGNVFPLVRACCFYSRFSNPSWFISRLELAGEASCRVSPIEVPPNLLSPHPPPPSSILTKKHSSFSHKCRYVAELSNLMIHLLHNVSCSICLSCHTFMLQGIHACWFDLRLQLLALASSSGAPVMRHMLFHYWLGQSLSDLPSQALQLMQTQAFPVLCVLCIPRVV